MQRIVAGEFRGRKLLELPRDLDGVRPTSSRVRSAIFDRLQLDVNDAMVLDLCAGTGALSIEALSRGAKHATMVEGDPKVAAFLKKQLAALRLGDRAQVVIKSATDFLATTSGDPPKWNLIVFDPPYHDRELYEAAAAAMVKCQAIAEGAIVVCEHEKPKKGMRPLFWPRGLALDARREHGSTWLDFLRVVRDRGPEPGASSAATGV
jgi:16S rRNA (guanine966-N2)-methyltransferase